jgi:hypothetical protein
MVEDCLGVTTALVFLPLATAQGPCQTFAGNCASRNLTSLHARSSVAPLPCAVVWSREVLRGDVSHPSIDGPDGVAGSIVAGPASELRDESNKATCVNGSGRHRSWSACSQRLAVAIHRHREACIQEGADRCHCRRTAVQ